MLDQKTFARFARSPASFRDNLLVDADGTARRFGEIQDPWQREHAAQRDPALLLAAGRGKKPAKARIFDERPRGHGKTFDIGGDCAYLLAFAARPVRGYCFAADQDQAALLKDAMQTLIRLNPWLGELLAVQKNCVVNIAAGHPAEGARLDISTSDVGSSYGILPDFIVADELCHWQGDGSLWDSLISSAAKRSHCLVLTITNAGFCDSWQWRVREAARTDPAWIFSRLDGPQASWLSPERLAEQQRMLPAVAYRRLWLNEWSSGGGDALTPADIAQAFDESLSPMTGKEPSWLFVAGVDLGLKRDASAVVVLAVPAGGTSGRIRLAHAKLWQPTPGHKIDLSEVEAHILQLDEQFGLETVAFDPWQMEHLAQRLEADSGHRRRNQRRRFAQQPWMREIPPTAANLREQATLTIESFQDRRLSLFPYEPLRRDLARLRVEEKSYGIRLTSPRDESGHGDTASAFLLALLVAHDLAGKRPIVAGTLQSGNQSPYQRALDRFAHNADRYTEEMRRLANPLLGEDQEGLLQAIVQLGGIRRLV